MSELEVASTRIITDLMDYRRGLSAVTVEERHTLALWTAKTAYALSSTAAPFDRRLPPSHPATLSKRELPHGVAAFAYQIAEGDAVREQADWLASASTYRYEVRGAEISEHEAHELHHEMYKVCFQFRRLLLLVGYTVPGWYPVIWNGIHHELMAETRLFSYNQDPEEFPRHNDGLARLAFHLSLAIAHENVVRASFILPPPPKLWLQPPHPLLRYL